MNAGRKFLYIDPLKQGLKLREKLHKTTETVKFLYIDPLKQGLKQEDGETFRESGSRFLYIDPLKQGLKHLVRFIRFPRNNVFIHRSIKTRIET